MPTAVLNGLLAGADLGQTVGLVNLSPYDGCLEKVCLSWHLDQPERKFSSLVISTDSDLVNYSEKVVSLYLFEASFKNTTVLFII